MNTNKLMTIHITQQVKVRKYEVDIPGLKRTLKQAKKDAKLTNKQIANIVNKPLTLVEHWFRGDNSFAIPSEDIWLQLKELLHIKTDIFDESILTFEYKDGEYDKSNRIYDVNGIAPTLTASNCQHEKFLIIT